MGQYLGTHLFTTGTGYFMIVTDYPDSRVTISKNKVGSLGEALLTFNGAYTRFKNLYELSIPLIPLMKKKSLFDSIEWFLLLK